MPTPNYAVTKKKPRRKTLNCKGQKVTKYLFNDAKDLKKEITLKAKANSKNKKKARKEMKTEKMTMPKRKGEQEKNKSITKNNKKLHEI